MTPEIIVALLSFLGTILGSLAGVIGANKLTSYRIEQLEKKVEKHNQLIERVYQLEKHADVLDVEIEQLKHS